MLKGTGPYKGKSKRTGMSPDDFDLLEITFIANKMVIVEYIQDNVLSYLTVIML